MDSNQIRRKVALHLNSQKTTIKLKFPIRNGVSKTKREQLVETLILGAYQNYYTIKVLEIKKRGISLWMDRICLVPFVVTGTWCCLPSSYLSTHNMYIHFTLPDYTKTRPSKFPFQRVPPDISTWKLPEPLEEVESHYGYY